MKILCIKVDKENQKKVLKHKYYYSKEKPTKDFDCLLLIGEAYGKGQVPLLAECVSAKLNEFERVQPAFTKNKEWKFEWIIGVNKIYNSRINILSYIKEGTPSYYSILKCKEMCYVDMKDFKLPLPKFSNVSYKIEEEEVTEELEAK